ncbi:MAG: hypothetical protein P4L31_04975 [Candidatus Babeliales bacterium]|nr:hypothetical protein [Candidatus Babeliales bacterium]
MSKTPKRIYNNVKMLCNKNNQTDPDQPAKFNQSRQDEIINDGLNRCVAIARFTLLSNNIPILIPKIQLSQNDINLTAYGIQLIYGAGPTYSNIQYLEYQCRNQYVDNTVLSPFNGQYDDPYYYMLNVTEMVDMFNNASAACLSGFLGSIGNPACVAPFLIYNGDNTFSIYYDQRVFGVENGMILCLNDNLYNLFRKFNVTWVRNQNNGVCNWQLNAKDRLKNSDSVNGVNYWVEKQSYPALDSWSPVDTIQFVTTMGIQTEFVSDVQMLNSTTAFGFSSNKVDSIMTDIVLPIVNPMDYNTMINYTASLYREIDLTVNELRDIGISCFWTDKKGNQKPIMLSDGDNVTMKMKFELE